MVKIQFDKMNNRSIALDEDTVIGECDFIPSEEGWNIVHTGVSDKYQGQGIARKLVECVIENAREASQKLTADCSYAKRVLENIDKA